VASGKQLQNASRTDGISPSVAQIIKPVMIGEVAAERYCPAINCEMPVAQIGSPLAWPGL
jgi:hypothetical protein